VEYVAFYAAWNPLKVSSARGTFVTSTASSEVLSVVLFVTSTAGAVAFVESPSTLVVVESPLIPHYSRALLLRRRGPIQQAPASVYAVG
jgi:hypothetical protein